MRFTFCPGAPSSPGRPGRPPNPEAPGSPCGRRMVSIEIPWIHDISTPCMLTVQAIHKVACLPLDQAHQCLYLPWLPALPVNLGLPWIDMTTQRGSSREPWSTCGGSALVLYVFGPVYCSTTHPIFDNVHYINIMSCKQLQTGCCIFIIFSLAATFHTAAVLTNLWSR